MTDETKAKKPKKKLKPNRAPMPKQTPEERVRNFEEVALGFTPELAMEEASRCIQCKKPLCVDGCPVEIDIPAFIGAIAEGDFKRSIRVLKEKNALPAVCGRVCPQEEQCEKVCVMGKKMEPVAIGRLERFAADCEAAEGKVELPEIAERETRTMKVHDKGSGF